MATAPNVLVSTQPPKKATRILAHIARILLGLLFAFSGSNGFFHFADPSPDKIPAGVVPLMTAFKESGYMLPLIFCTQLAIAVLLLTNRWVPFALVMLAPMMVHIIAMHAALDLPGIVPGLVCVGFQAFLVYVYRDYYRTLFAFRATPG